MIDRDDPEAWSLYKNGLTKGIFQLESNHGRNWSKKLAPENIEELSALIALLRPGCISYSTKITVAINIHKDGNRRFITDTIQNIANRKEKYSHIISYDEDNGCLIENEMEDIFNSGTKECFNVKLNKGKTQARPWYDLKCTDDHPLLTNSGWKMLKDISVGERIAVIKRIGGAKPRKTTAANRHVKNGPRYKNVLGHRRFSDICYKNYEEKCCICGWNNLRPDTHHIYGNRYTDNSPENLCFVCPNHHREITSGLISLEEVHSAKDKCKLIQKKDIEWATYAGKESVGYEMVYDISMKAPHSNFVAGNVIVHNCTKAIIDGKSMTQRFVDRKHKREEVSYLHASLEDILKPTYGVLVYQEQAMRIAVKLAGFNETETDNLRKAIGKKKADLMASIRNDFIAGCKNVGLVDEETAKEIFGWIEKSSRYSFNKCLSPDTVVITEYGEKTLAEVKVGDKVLAPRGDQDEFVEILDVINSGEKEVYEVEMRDGKTITCSIDHKFLCSDGKKRPLFEILDGDLEIMCID